MIEEYQPELTVPLYPWTQLFGIASGLVVLARMALVPVRGRDGDRPALARLVHAVHRLVEAVDCTAVMVQTGEGNRGGLVKRLVLDRLFG
ncbi:hypothetical protein [Natronorarus salvus]|uniref:hypothetical protein n=1 Tax=Natronorarus salvus TaxID=3117733 RepID=UPI002F265CFC